MTRRVCLFGNVHAPNQCRDCRRAHAEDHLDGLESLARTWLSPDPIVTFCDQRQVEIARLEERVQRVYHRAKKTGHITAAKADELACQLGQHPSQFWPEVFS